MATEPAKIEPAPKQPSRVWKWLKRIGCALVLMSFTCCGLSCVGGWWLLHAPYNMHKEEVDHFHAEALRGGDIKAIHDRADAKLRQRITVEELQQFLAERPGILKRSSLQGVYFRKQTIDGVDYVKVRSKPSFFTVDEWEIVFKVVDGVLVLVGVSPGLDEDVPTRFRYRGSSGGLWWD